MYTLSDFPGNTRKGLSLCKTSGMHALLVGGYSAAEGKEYLTSCMRLVLTSYRGTWEQMPSMNVARTGCSSCSLAGYAYVFGGRNNDGLLNSIEKLRVFEPLDEQMRQEWQLIPAENFVPQLTPRSVSVVCALN